MVGLLLSLEWVRGAQVPTGVAYPAGALVWVDDTPYLALVCGHTGSDFTTDNQWYDVVADTWIVQSSFAGAARYDAGGCAALFAGDPNFWVFSGSEADAWSFTVYSDYYRYDPQADAWTRVGTMPRDAIGEGVRAASLGDTIYIVGGHDSDGMSYDSTKRSLYRYVPSDDSWTKLSPLPAPDGLADQAWIACGDKIYSFGGVAIDAAYNYYFVNDAYEYDPATDSWRTITPLPGSARSGVAAAVLGGKVWLIGGTGGDPFNPTDYPDVYIYDPSTDTYQPGPFLPAAHDGGAAIGVPLSVYEVELSEPSDGAAVDCQCDTFRWQPLEPTRIVYAGEGTATSVTNYTYLLKSDIDYYIFRISEDPSFSTYFEDTTSSTSYEYCFTSADDGKTFYWSVLAVDELGDTSSMDTFSLTVECSLFSGSEQPAPGLTLRLIGSKLIIEGLRGEARVRVYRADGRLELSRRISGPGRVEITLNLPSGVYWVKVEARGERRTLRAVLR